MKRARFFTIVLASVAGAYLAGQFVGDLVAEQSTSGYKNKRQDQTDSYLHTRPIAVGDTLPDYPFETLASDTILLSSCLSAETYLVIIHPECGTCLDELDQIARLERSFGRSGPFIFISSGNPRSLADLKRSYDLANPFLYDHRSVFLSRYELIAYPMFIRINQDRVVQEIMLGALLPEEIELALQETK